MLYNKTEGVYREISKVPPRETAGPARGSAFLELNAVDLGRGGGRFGGRIGPDPT